MKGNPFWDYSDPNNAVCMCSKHHDEFEKLNANDRIEYIKEYSCISFILLRKILDRMKALLKGKRPKSIYPKAKMNKKNVGKMLTKTIVKEFLPDEKF